MRDPWLVVGCIWAIYLAVRLGVEAVRIYALPRIVAAGRGHAPATAPDPASDRRRSGRRRWTPLPAMAWLAAEASLAAVVVGGVWLALQGLGADPVPASVAGAHDDARRQAVVAAILGWSLFVINVPVSLRLIGRLLPAESHKPQDGVDPERMGATIGVLERLLVVALVPGGGPAGVGFVVAAKTLARFKELNKKRFAERYLLGTMGSVTVALLSVLAAEWIWTSRF